MRKLLVVFFVFVVTLSSCQQESKKPNVLLVISDDQSFVHTSRGGSSFIQTPAFDKIAKEGFYFTNCYAGSPGCAPSRSSLLTGRHHWQNEQSGQHASSWMAKHVPFVDELASNGYVLGRTGKGASPFYYGRKPSWRKENAAGPLHTSIKYTYDNDPRTGKGINVMNYAENFRVFMDSVRSDEEPFFFWYGATEPHQPFEKGSWQRTNKELESVSVPDFLPDAEVVRGELLDYAVEIEWYDSHLGKMIDILKAKGELENTIIIVTSDNGMPFPGAKANAYDYGIHVPLAIRMPQASHKEKIVNELVSFIDFAPTILELCGVSPKKMLPIRGKSFANILKGRSSKEFSNMDRSVFVGRERHSSSRYNNWGYPQRSIRQGDYLLTWNLKSDRWPAGAPRRYNFKGELQPLYGLDKNGTYMREGAFNDIDDCPTKSYIIQNHKSLPFYFEYATAKRPEYELFDLKADPFCMKNLANDMALEPVFNQLKNRLAKELKDSGDPRYVGPEKDIFDTYERYSKLRAFPNPE